MLAAFAVWHAITNLPKRWQSLRGMLTWLVL
jgi:hypothetical protein